MRDFEKTRLAATDIDDTVIENSSRIYRPTYVRALGSIGINMTENEFGEIAHRRWGQSGLDVISYAAAEYLTRNGIENEVGPDHIMAAAAQYEEELYDIFANQAVLVPGAIEAFERLHTRDVLIGAATGLRRDIFERVLRDNGVDKSLFVRIVSAYDIEDPLQRKPHPLSLEDIKARAIEARGAIIWNEQIVYSGDAANDVRMARAVPGVEAVVVETGHLTRQDALDMDVPAHNIIPDISHIEEILERREKAA